MSKGTFHDDAIFQVLWLIMNGILSSSNIKYMCVILYPKWNWKLNIELMVKKVYIAVFGAEQEIL